MNHALVWIQKQGNGPFFVWIHVFDPHAPYEPPEPFASRYKDAPYDGEIAYTDSVMGKLFERLKADKLYDGALIAVMADHGEALGEHGEEGHGFFLYDPTVRVPLVIKMPANADAGKQIHTRVELADVMPTMLEAVGVSVPKEVQGKSLLPLISRETSREKTKIGKHTRRPIIPTVHSAGARCARCGRENIFTCRLRGRSYTTENFQPRRRS